MGKIYKYANIYDKDATSDNYKAHLIRHVNSKGVLENYTLDELKKLVDDLYNDKDEDGNIKNYQAFKNASSILEQYLYKDGLKNAMRRKKQRPIEEQVSNALKEVYDEYEEIKEA